MGLEPDQRVKSDKSWLKISLLIGDSSTKSPIILFSPKNISLIMRAGSLGFNKTEPLNASNGILLVLP